MCMEFLIVAYDGTDAGAPERRLSVRENHLKHAKLMKEKGHLIEGGAILNEQGQMIGSTLLVRFDSRKDLERWLDNDPYKLGNVWIDIRISPIKLVSFEA